MRIVNVSATLESASPLIMGRRLPEGFEKPEKSETGTKFEERVWRHRAHKNADGQLVLPAEYFTQSLQLAASYKGQKIEGKGNATYTRHFKGGAYCLGDLVLPIHIGEAKYTAIDCYANGKAGSRVWRWFPQVLTWSGVVEYKVIDDDINEAVFRDVLECSGMNVGIGSFRPANGNQNGRFVVTDLKWEAKE